MTRPSQIIRDAGAFHRWYQKRAEPNDRAIVRAAKRAGLVVGAAKLIFLTAAGQKLHSDGSAAHG